MTAGVASLAVRDLLRGIRRNGRVLAALPQAIYLEFADPVPEPRVITISPPDAIRLPNAIIAGPWEARPGIWLDDLFVRPSHRRSGLGRELLDELRNRTSGRVEWDMQAGNEKAEAFYAQLGAEPVPGWVRYRWRT